MEILIKLYVVALALEPIRYPSGSYIMGEPPSTNQSLTSAQVVIRNAGRNHDTRAVSGQARRFIRVVSIYVAKRQRD